MEQVKSMVKSCFNICKSSSEPATLRNSNHKARQILTKIFIEPEVNIDQRSDHFVVEEKYQDRNSYQLIFRLPDMKVAVISENESSQDHLVQCILFVLYASHIIPKSSKYKNKNPSRLLLSQPLNVQIFCGLNL